MLTIHCCLSHLELLERDLLLAVVLGDEEAVGLHACAVVFHVQRDRPPGLGAAAHVVELEPHQRLHQRCEQSTDITLSSKLVT